MINRRHSSADANLIYWVIRGSILVVLMLPLLAGADNITKEVKTSAEISKQLNYLLGFVGPNRNDLKTFTLDRLGAVLNYVLGNKQRGILYHPDAIDGTPSAYFEIDVARSLDQILRLTDNPEVPAEFTAPSTVRSARWKRIDTPNHQRPKLWEQLPDTHSTVFFTGIEHLVNTPDQTTGAYYEYDLDRTVILTQVEGRNLLISLSRQAGISEAGKKGLIVGKDDQWDYLYTGQSGLNRFGLGWVDSYMYDSYSVAFYLENTDAQPSVRFAVFKWLKAGWSDINFVKRSHIYAGLKRFAEVFKEIVENPHIANSSSWPNALANIQKLQTDQLQPSIQAYLTALQQRVEAEDSLSPDEVKTLFKDRNYLKTLERDEMQSIVTLEYLKYLLGKPVKLDLRQVIPNSLD